MLTLSMFDSQHVGSEDLAINNTRFRHYLSLIGRKTTAKLYKRTGCCVPKSKHKVMRTGIRIHLMEAVTMEYIATHTSIPIPRVYCSFLYEGRAYIVMERTKGQRLAGAWRGLSNDSRKKILSQLRSMLQELPSLKPLSGTGVASCNGGSLYNSGLLDAKPRFGPFKTAQDFHYWLRDGLEVGQHGKHVSNDEVKSLEAMIKRQNCPWPASVFTHCDLNTSNNLVRGDNIVGILDWESAGWYPSHWEYTSAWRWNVLATEWQKHLLSVLDPYPEELEMEKTRCQWWESW